MAAKIDLRRSLDCYAARPGEFRTIEVPPLQYLMIDGHGDPNTSAEYAAAVATLYPVAYALKFTSREQLDRDYVVMPLEALWWADDMAAFTRRRDKDRWSWTVMVMTPDWILPGLFEEVRDRVAAKKDLAAIDRLRLETLHEGPAVQTLHVGPYDDEGPVLTRLHEEEIAASGRRMTGHHHEIYLNDPRRVAPQRLRTILRQPVTRE